MCVPAWRHYLSGSIPRLGSWAEPGLQLLFAAADVLAGWQVWHILQLQRVPQDASMWAVLAWLYNPFTVTISTRGSCDVLVVNMLLAILLMLFTGRMTAAALLYGLAVHFRIYPIVYAPAIVAFLAQREYAMKQGKGASSSAQPSKVGGHFCNSC
jgi:phosphatidylinositol glycan class M